jgi:hypothetical protein
MQSGILYESVISSDLTVEEKNRIDSLSVADLSALATAHDEATLHRLFGPCPHSRLAKVRTYALDAKRKKTMKKPIEEGLLSSVWQGKSEVKLEPKGEAVEMVISTGQKEFRTGVTPLVTFDGVPTFLHRAVYFTSCYTVETKATGIISTVDEKLAQKFPEYNLMEMVNIASMLEKMREKANFPKEDKTGVQWQQKLARLLSIHSETEQISFNNLVLIKVMQAASVDQKRTKELKVVAPDTDTINEDMVKEMKMTRTVKKKTVEYPLLGWSKNIKPKMAFARAVNPSKGTEGFGTEIMWAQEMTSLIGMTNISPLSYSVGLCPGSLSRKQRLLGLSL